MGEGIKTFDCEGRTTREINAFLKETARLGPDASVALLHPDSRHNLAVGLTTPLRLHVEGHVGYYCAGLCEDVDVRVAGDAGWGLAENLMSGRVQATGSAGSAAGATMRGGTVIVGGNAGARCGVAMKGGTLIVGGDTGEALGDSLYEGRIYVRGRIEALGSDAVQADLTDADISLLSAALADADMEAAPADLKKIVSGKKLYNFDTKEKEIWKNAL